MTRGPADYLVSAVRYNAAGTRVETLWIHEDRRLNVHPGRTTSRVQMLAWLETGYSIRTATRDGMNGWERGRVVKLVEVDGQTFLKTRPDRTRADYLDLPIF